MIVLGFPQKKLLLLFLSLTLISMSDTTGSPATMPKQGESLWNYYALGGPKCTICGKHVRRPVNRNAHAEMHVRRGEAHEAFSGIAYHTEFLVGAKP